MKKEQNLNTAESQALNIPVVSTRLYTLEEVKIILRMQRDICAKVWEEMDVNSKLLKDYEKISRASEPIFDGNGC